MKFGIKSKGEWWIVTATTNTRTADWPGGHKADSVLNGIPSYSTKEKAMAAAAVFRRAHNK